MSCPFKWKCGHGGTDVLSPTNVPTALISGKTYLLHQFPVKHLYLYMSANTHVTLYSMTTTNYGGTFGDGSSIKRMHIIGSGSGSEVATEMIFHVPSPNFLGLRLLASNAANSIAWDIFSFQFFPNTDWHRYSTVRRKLYLEW